jgi:OOP family OmpA-OmpF porin
MASIIQQGVAFSIHFRTDSDQIENHISEQCRRFTALARLFPQLVVNLEGYADPRGESSYNLSLSKRRLESVRQLLIEAGIDGALIQVTAKGEEELLNPGADHDSHPFERRVVITFSQQDGRS